MVQIVSLLISLGIIIVNGHAVCEPVFANPPGSLTTQPLSVSLTSNSTQQIYYTTDGSSPWLILDESFNNKDNKSFKYNVNEPIDIDQTTTIKAIAFCGTESSPSLIGKFHYQFYTPPGNLPMNFTNSLGIEFSLVPPLEPNGQPFYISKYEITQSQWQSLMVSNPSRIVNSEGPVEQVNFNDVQNYISKLNELETNNRYSLPSKSEWIHAANSGGSDRYHFGNEHSLLQYYSWYGLNSDQPKTRGGKLPNGWGIYDFYGNVREWVQDDYPSHTGYRFTMNCSYSNRSTRACFTQSFTLNPVSYYSPNLGFRLKAKSLYSKTESPFLPFQNQQIIPKFEFTE